MRGCEQVITETNKRTKEASRFFIAEVLAAQVKTESNGQKKIHPETIGMDQEYLNNRYY